MVRLSNWYHGLLDNYLKKVLVEQIGLWDYQDIQVALYGDLYPKSFNFQSVELALAVLKLRIVLIKALGAREV